MCSWSLHYQWKLWVIIANRWLLHEVKLILNLHSFFSGDLISKWKFFLWLILSRRGITWVKYRVDFSWHSARFIIVGIIAWILKNFCSLYFILRASSFFSMWYFLLTVLVILYFTTHHIQYLISLLTFIHIFFKEVVMFFVFVF